jgi:hypothetical protein
MSSGIQAERARTHSARRHITVRLLVWCALSITVLATFSVGTASPSFAGSICRDGTWTASEGRGTCSYHGGVAQKGVPKPAGATVIGSGSNSSAGSSAGSATADTSTNTPDPLESVNSTTIPTDPAVSSLGSGGREAALAVLASLPVRPATASGYARSKFRHWVTAANGCSTREVVLIRDAITVNAKGCRVISGEWFSPFDSTTGQVASRLDIDHMVPLKEAWVSGASAWSAARRQAFANDLGWRGSLIAVSASSNRSKGDRDPARWMPPNSGYWCTYLFDWIDVKYRWSLSVDATEKQAIGRDLSACPDDGFALAPVAP